MNLINVSMAYIQTTRCRRLRLLAQRKRSRYMPYKVKWVYPPSGLWHQCKR